MSSRYLLGMNQEFLPCPVPVAHTYNPSYSGDRDQEDYSLRLAQANTF
jgi:hypothetical protein